MIKPKILIVGAFPPPGSPVVGGIVTTCKTMMASDFPSHFDLILIDSTQRTNPPPNLMIRLLGAVIRFKEYLFALLFNRPDGVLLFAAVGPSIAEKGLMAWAARIVGIPASMFPRGAQVIEAARESPLQKLWIKAAMRGATQMLCQGPAWQRFAVDELGFESSRCPIIYNWTATPELIKIGKRRVPPSANKIPKILFLGWLEREKGVFELLGACRRLSEKHKFRLLIAGNGNAERRAKDYVMDCEMDKFVEFLGWVHGERKRQLLEEADILVLPSWIEGFPNTVIEAMAAKLAVVVSAVGNVPDILANREQALLIPPKNEEMLWSALDELMCNPGLCASLAENGHSFARDHFTTESAIARLVHAVKANTHGGSR